jgi:hypothetical protein
MRQKLDPISNIDTGVGLGAAWIAIAAIAGIA